MEDSKIYKRLKDEHPDWSEAKLRTQEAVEASAQAVISEEGPAVKITERILEMILQRAKRWLMEKLPEIFAQVAEMFAQLIDTLPDWAQKGISYVIDFIKDFLKGGF